MVPAAVEEPAPEGRVEKEQECMIRKEESEKETHKAKFAELRVIFQKMEEYHKKNNESFMLAKMGKTDISVSEW